MRYRWWYFSLAFSLILLGGFSDTHLWGQDPSPVEYPPPRISSISPDSCLVHWDPYANADFSTHYQVRLNTFLFGASTRQTVMPVTHLIPGNTNKIDYVIYHQGKILGISRNRSCWCCLG